MTRVRHSVLAVALVATALPGLATAQAAAPATQAGASAQPARSPLPVVGAPGTPTAEAVPLEALVPVDSRITVGTLSNGLRYYVRANVRPQGRAELRLVV